ncbi:hypothetical protein [Lentzea cavernae]|uniref:Luciferase-like monooxygenase n=1 Tax=Lentzea cavernae TaxID=2020703 RepID=A0ABQ3M3K6_9PSEU|nr:hypothetical protein [Lentzea cavernae]GHH30922.1 hypothetical protein GCM10017774_09560 [Lentzea cavernae]
MDTGTVQVGVFTAGDLDPAGIVAPAVAAGLDVFAVGEHHDPPCNSPLRWPTSRFGRACGSPPPRGEFGNVQFHGVHYEER